MGANKIMITITIANKRDGYALKRRRYQGTDHQKIYFIRSLKIRGFEFVMYKENDITL